MSAHSNAKLAQEIYNHFSNNQFDAVLAHATDDIEVFAPAFGQTFHGHQGFKQFMMSFKTAFPNISITVKNQVVTDDAVVTEFTALGTNSGPMLTPQGELPPTGRTAEFTVCEVWQVRNGKLASLTNYQDFGVVLRQLGL
jgi:steroid delta-isomerase-like uncharacterized protein